MQMAEATLSTYKALRKFQTASWAVIALQGARRQVVSTRKNGLDVRSGLAIQFAYGVDIARGGVAEMSRRCYSESSTRTQFRWP